MTITHSTYSTYIGFRFPKEPLTNTIIKGKRTRRRITRRRLIIKIHMHTIIIIRTKLHTQREREFHQFETPQQGEEDTIV
jgi:hypothetical protein